MRFGEGHDWHDVYEFDWPTIKPGIEAGSLPDTDPFPVPEFDLAQAAAGRLTGAASTALRWDQIGDETFERLLYDLLREFPEHENVTWLTRTRAPDRGRDLALDRVLRDGTGGVRHERVIVPAKHWLSKSVGMAENTANVAAVRLWQPPVVRGLLIVTSGRFSSDAVAWVDRLNESAVAPHIDLWPEGRLETLLAQRPHLVAAHGLR
ncbi:restriction endonuclease [Rhodococcus sp. HNM0563]|uniref:restriction endonuclease n=1 Tax=Rhodococcus sp. HNM0563 TaxID=2716339 RepID=UPI00146D3655|nr:restriction endonuclease [Rhodococcus sp. HNM0563]NLU63565.1 restriction endonuclease [Rhodococcus sp. HNM0563]